MTTKGKWQSRSNSRLKMCKFLIIFLSRYNKWKSREKDNVFKLDITEECIQIHI